MCTALLHYRAVIETQLLSFHKIVADSLQLVSTLNISASSLPHLSKLQSQQSIMEVHVSQLNQCSNS